MDALTHTIHVRVPLWLKNALQQEAKLDSATGRRTVAADVARETLWARFAHLRPPAAESRPRERTDDIPAHAEEERVAVGA